MFTKRKAGLPYRLFKHTRKYYPAIKRNKNLPFAAT
jgi:hypothetical protein